MLKEREKDKKRFLKLRFLGYSVVKVDNYYHINQRISVQDADPKWQYVLAAVEGYF